MIIININGVLEIITFILALVAIVISLMVVLETDKKLRSCYKYIFLALIIFGVTEFFGILNEFQITAFGLWFYEVLELLFIGLLVIGILNIQKGIKERQTVTRKKKK